MQNRYAIARLFPLIVACSLPSGGGALWAQEQASPTPASATEAAADAAAPAGGAPDERPIEYWIEQLDSDRFAQRQAATSRIARFGDAAIEPLVAVTRTGKLEMTQRAISVLQSLATGQGPDDAGGAWGALEQLEAEGAGSAAVAAKDALDDIRRERETQAYAQLAAVGVQIGFRDVVIHARSLTNQEVVWIDKKWRGNVAALGWLRWVRRVDHAVIEGDAVRQDVLRQVVKMPELRSIVLREAVLRDDIFEPLATLSRIDDLELRYIRLDLEDADRLAVLPLRVSLGLMGTGMPIEGAQKIREAMPGLNLVYKQGGFLGVVCNNFMPRCQIDAVKPGGAAANAGLQPGDVIVRIDDQPIGTFEDLQLQIGSHLPGDEVEITFERLEEVDKVKLKLGKLEGE